jgi:hypothetical protein
MRLASVLAVLLCVSVPSSAQSERNARIRDTTIADSAESACAVLGVGCDTVAEHFIVVVGEGQKLVASIWFKDHPYPLSGSVVDVVSGRLAQGFNSVAEQPPRIAPCGPEFHYTILKCDFEMGPTTDAEAYRFHIGRNPVPEPWEPTLLRAIPGGDHCTVVFENEYATWEISALTDGTCASTAPIWSAP